MKKYKEWTYTDKIRWRIRALWARLACMLVYMVLVGVLGGGDSRVMTPLARLVSRVIFFGGFGYAAYRIHFNRKLLSNQCLLKEQWKHTQDERNRYLHDKSGGIVVDLLLVLLLFLTLHTSLFNMTAFWVSFFLLAATVVLKSAAYLFFSRG